MFRQRGSLFVREGGQDAVDPHVDIRSISTIARSLAARGAFPCLGQFEGRNRAATSELAPKSPKDRMHQAPRVALGSA